MKFQKVHRDTNHSEIVKDLAKHGIAVIDLAAVGSGVPDIVVSDGVTTALIEIKMPKSQIYISQLEFLAKWPGVAGFAQTFDDVMALLHDPETNRLTKQQQSIIRQICLDYRAKTTDMRPRIRIMEFEKLFREACGSL